MGRLAGTKLLVVNVLKALDVCEFFLGVYKKYYLLQIGNTL